MKLSVISINLLLSVLCLSSCWLSKKRETSEDTITLNLRVHLMQTDPWVHGTGVALTSWVTPSQVTSKLMPEINAIWEQANIHWDVESIIQEDIVEFDGYEDSIDFVLNTERNDQGESDPARLPHLYNMMQPEYRSTNAELGTNLFHVYLFPFTGNTSQGNAMANYGYHVVIGTWTNKHNGGTLDTPPEKHKLVESHSNFDRGSLAQTMAHELGHVLSLRHQQCTDCLMSSDGYDITAAQIETARTKASLRAQ